MDEGDALTPDEVDCRVQERMFLLRQDMYSLRDDDPNFWTVWNQTSAAVGSNEFSRQDWLKTI